MINKRITYVVLAIMVTSCSNKENNEFLGKMIGTAVGAVVGSKLGDGENTKAIYSILGAAGGYLLGKKIGELLSIEEQNDLNENIINSLNNSEEGQTTKWQSKENKNTYAEIKTKNKNNIEGRKCREYEKMLFKNGRQIKEKSQACRDINGNWIIS